MKVISETCHAHLIQYLHLYWSGVHDEGFFRNVSCTLNSISTLYWCGVPDEGFFRNVSCTLNSISTFVLVWGTWWILIQKRIMVSNLYRGPSIDVSYQVSYHLAKRLQRKSCFRNRPIRNKNCLWRPCLLTDQNGMSNSHRGPSLDASYHVSEEKIF